MSDRTTVIIGAGLPLNLDLPDGSFIPSTKNITTEVCKPYPDYTQYLNNKNAKTNIVADFYDYLVQNYPIPNANNPYINFEDIFHCMEEYMSYSYAWNKSCINTDICPVFGPFTNPAILFDVNIISSVMKQFLLRIMDVVNVYDQYFISEINGREKWLNDFIKGLGIIDVFNFNYDTMIENILGNSNYTDGFIPTSVTTDYWVFSPEMIINRPDDISTINHLHGCINLFHTQNPNSHVNELRHEDWVQYPDYNTVRKKMVGTSQSQPHTQSGETIYNGPIITGLNKTAKLNCVPFDFYHANLVNSITKNHKLLIIGYSFGDLYCNQLIQRMNLIHGDDARVCIIDYWGLNDNYRHTFSDFADNLKHDLGATLCIYSNATMFSEAVVTMQPLDRNAMMKSPSNKLMLGINGLKSASTFANEIYLFLNS